MVAALSLVFYFISFICGALLLLGAHDMPYDSTLETALQATAPQLAVLGGMFVVTQGLGVAVLRKGRTWQAVLVLIFGLLLILTCVADVIYLTLQGIGEGNAIPLMVSGVVFAVQATCLVSGVAARDRKPGVATS